MVSIIDQQRLDYEQELDQQRLAYEEQEHQKHLDEAEIFDDRLSAIEAKFTQLIEMVAVLVSQQQ